MCIPTISMTSESLSLIKSDDSNALDRCAVETHTLAWHLSQKPHNLRPYLDSLPTSSDLPRLWPEQTLQIFLLGSPILRHIEETRRHVRLCYDQAKGFADETPPTWDEYSHAHAMVTSRAFHYDHSSTGESDRIASLHMVPGLDLCNHCRGGTDPTNNEQNQKNVSYTFRKFPEEVGDTAVTNSERGRTVVVVDVVATKDIPPHESIRITYGAKPNSVLLVNYGFTIPNNMEPDGSSNDILEFYPPQSDDNHHPTRDASPTTILRTGPPSYTYGCFTTALQAFWNTKSIVPSAPPRDGSVNGEDDDGDEGDNDDMEQFLNECEDDEDDDDNDNDEMDDEDATFDMITSPVDLHHDHNSSRHNAADERQALQDFRNYLLQLMDAYTLPKTATIDWTNFVPSVENMDGPSEQRRQMYAANLIHSEMRILQFYIWATERLSHTESTWSKPGLTLNDNDVDLMHRQVDDLVSAYKKLRH